MSQGLENAPKRIGEISKVIKIRLSHLAIIAIVLVLAPAITSGSESEEADVNVQELRCLALEVYLDEGGNALVVGYIESEDLGYLPFLEQSDYIYEDGELYALTNCLVFSEEDYQRLEFVVSTQWDEYHVTFYLPLEVKLDRVDLSESLEYRILEQDDSILVEVLGYDAKVPSVEIFYKYSQEQNG